MDAGCIVWVGDDEADELAARAGVEEGDGVAVG